MSRQLAVVKPDFGARGGFERHLDALVEGLADRGWDVTIEHVDGRTRPRYLYGVRIDDAHLALHDEYFLHLALVERVQQLDLAAYDAVLTTQPPTYLVDHDRTVALFYHHARQFYDLADAFTASGFVDAEIHAAATEAIRALETPAVSSIRHWLAGSAEVADRLRRFWSIPAERISIHRAPPASWPSSATPYRPGGPILTVGRHEWPKRNELVVQAAHVLGPDRPLTHFVGGGSRLEVAVSLDAELGADPTLAAHLDDAATWRNRGIFTKGWAPFEGSPSGRVSFEGEVDDRRRDELYASASLVVAPAYREDYGLTVLEAMARGRPVIVCSDGGGLTELVEDGENGLVVEPTAKALAAGIERILDDPAAAARMGAAGLAVVQDITIEGAVSQVAGVLAVDE
ncbi:MAG: glycosyltransferase family 4 protein [Acidimicrobiales bacterium]